MESEQLRLAAGPVLVQAAVNSADYGRPSVQPIFDAGPGAVLLWPPRDGSVKSNPYLTHSLRTAGFFFSLFSCVIALWAGDKPWNSKPYETWDAKDVRSVMTESPWVQVTTIRRSWLSVAAKDVPPEEEIHGKMRHFPIAAGRVQANTEAINRASEASYGELIVYIYWYSSRVVRAASAREAALHGQIKESEVEKYTEAPQQEYQIDLHMADMAPFMIHEEEFFQDNALLRMQRSELELVPSRVVYERDRRGRVKDVVFFFPKKNSEDFPTITSDETDVQFNCKLGDSTLRVNFKPQKMVDQFGPDL
jgi:hypothetical protein